MAWATRLLVTELGGGVGDGARIVEFCCGVSDDDPPPPHALMPNKNRLTISQLVFLFAAFLEFLFCYETLSKLLI